MTTVELPRDEAEATAYHEAGHAVMGCILGRPPRSVSIIPDYGVVGHTSFDDDCPPCAKSHFDRSEEKKRYIGIRVLIEVAGTIAHDIKSPGRIRDTGDATDGVLADELAESVDDNPARYLQRARNEAHEHLKKHWAWVEAVAAALVERKQLTRSEVLSLRP